MIFEQVFNEGHQKRWGISAIYKKPTSDHKKICVSIEHDRKVLVFSTNGKKVFDVGYNESGKKFDNRQQIRNELGEYAQLDKYTDLCYYRESSYKIDEYETSGYTLFGIPK